MTLIQISSNIQLMQDRVERAARGALEWFGVVANADVEAMAAALHRWVGLELDGAQLPQEIARRCGWRIVITQLGAADADMEAALVPLVAGGFSIVVDPELSPSDLSLGSELAVVIAGRIAHEIGHALFYESGTPPLRSAKADRLEETLCDALAGALLRRRATIVAATPST